MYQDTATTEPPVTPPPIPARSYVRDGPAYQSKLCAIKAGIASPLASSPTSQGIFEEIDRELTDTRQRLASAIIESNRMGGGDAGRLSWESWESWEGSGAEVKTSGADSSVEEGCTKRESRLSEDGFEIRDYDALPDALRPTLLRQRPRGSRVCSKGGEKERERRGLRQGSHDEVASAADTSYLSCRDDRSLSSTYSEEKMETKVEDWLARRFPTSSSHAVEVEVDSPKQLSGECGRGFSVSRPSLSLFPPESPRTGNREYLCTPPGSPFPRPLCPMSPLGNGRDAYGNFIPSNTQDYFTAQSPTTSLNLRPVLESEPSSTTAKSPPIVRLRGGGWKGFNSFWKSAGAEEPTQEPHSTSQHTVIDQHGIARDIPAVSYAGRSMGRTPPSVQSKFSTTRPMEYPNTPESTQARLAELSAEEGTHPTYAGEHVASTNCPKTVHSAKTDGSSDRRARVNAVLEQHFGRQLSSVVPLSLTTRPLPTREQENTYGSADVPVRDDPGSPYIDTTFAQPSSQSAVASPSGYPNYSRRPTQPIVNQRPTSGGTVMSWEPQTAPREDKRWNRDDYPPPPRAPPPEPPSCLPPQVVEDEDDDVSRYSDDGDHRAPSIISTSTADDPLKDLPGLKTSGAYRKVDRDREVKRIETQRRLHEEADRRRQEIRRRQQEPRRRESDRNTIVPDDSITEVIKRRNLETRREVQPMVPVDEQHHSSPPAPSQYLPRHGRIPVHARSAQQQNHAKSSPLAISAHTPNGTPHTGGPRKKTMKKAASFAGKLSRLILAAPSDPNLKTYSSRHPPAEETRQRGMSADRSGWPTSGTGFGPSGIPLPPLDTTRLIERQKSKRPRQNKRNRENPTGWRAGFPRTGITRKDKGKGKARSEDRRSEGAEFKDLASNPVELPATPAVNISLTTGRSTGPTRPAHLGFPRSGPRAPPRQNEVAEPVPSPPSTEPYVTRREPGEILPFTPELGYPYNTHLNTFYNHARTGSITCEWVTDHTNAHQRRRCSTDSGLDEATTEAIAVCEDAAAAANMRSSFSSSSESEAEAVRWKKKSRGERLWRREDAETRR
ncbi:hypothetical protein BDW02DRAFT_314122 [Decorospora gaudefroyi]|uniref:Uncharacterized protein n=1 Tax=Decorospora gaudefroyi TaxID=184978 RepID=A0A6A5KC92_9PLEO|nr:hypothetical protein BDW02DRAFT_314122 [Decorospora gaudefroyi]